MSFFFFSFFFFIFLSLFFLLSLHHFQLLRFSLSLSRSFSPSFAPHFLRNHHSYVEQLGTFMPIEAPQAGELVAFLVDEGSPVEYRQPVAEIAPFFGGHIIGDSKHA